MASDTSKPKSKIAETSFQGDDKSDPSEGSDKGKSTTPSSSSPVEVKPEETNSEAPSDSSLADDSSIPSNIFTIPGERARLAVIPVLNEIARIVPGEENLPILSRSTTYGGLSTDEPSSGKRTARERAPLINNEETVDSNQFLGSDEPANLEFATRQNSLEDNPPSSSQQTLTFIERYSAFSIYAADSFIMLPFLFLLLVLSLIFIYMGIEYYQQCPLMENLPIFFMLMGATGILGILTRYIHILSIKGWLVGYKNCGFVTIAALLGLMVFYISEAVDVYFIKGSPTTEHGTHYCHPVFYSFVYWMNLALLLIKIALAVLHAPLLWRVTYC